MSQGGRFKVPTQTWGSRKSGCSGRLRRATEATGSWEQRLERGRLGPGRGRRRVWGVAVCVPQARRLQEAGQPSSAPRAPPQSGSRRPGPPLPGSFCGCCPPARAQGELCGPQAPPPPSPLGRLRVARGLGVLLCHRPVIHHAATPRAVPRAPGSCPACFSLITRESSQIFKHAAFLQEFPCWVL